MIETRTTDAVNFLALPANLKTHELVANARSLIETNIDYFRSVYAEHGEQDPYKHVVIYAVHKEIGDKIVAYRYFMMVPGDALCRMFATFVDEAYRRSGLASRLIREAFETAASGGNHRFEVRLSTPETLEKNGLFEWYLRYADANADRFRVTVYYTGKKYRYPR